ncbi:hypothetical protein [Tenacibaculum sp. 1_MG-2023]|uniref:hypothetical protein n=1 Tax=Tenacibaculum sp. 1_MG-2023 TaxID=3062653 RepID=UPI0026E1F3F8|nr:hypothetical protein [Tenacibaculum sp. 1_MG-2023]MDO6600020.1 hypothetical protein [Tenacibaculum sp. 1_MG-2023]
MKTKITLIITLLLITLKISSQEEKALTSKDGVKITYQLLLEDEGKKKDKYILIVNAINESDIDLYYKVKLIKNKEGKWSLPFISEQKGFTKIKVRNSTGLFGNGQSLFGEQTNLLTIDNSILYKIKKEEIYTQETTFKVKKDKKPLITNTFSKKIKPLDQFDLKISKQMLDGDYLSSCGNIKVNINSGNSTEKGDYLLQTTNGKQFTWIRSSETTFVRENNSDYTLTFNKDNGTYTYSTSDGITCSWERE